VEETNQYERDGTIQYVKASVGRAYPVTRLGSIYPAIEVLYLDMKP